MPARPPAMLLPNHRWLAPSREPHRMTWRPFDRTRIADPRIWMIALLGVPLGWAALAMAVNAPLLAVQAPRARMSVETATALCWLFGAVIVLAGVDAADRARRRWIASGLAVLGFGGLGFRICYPLVTGSPDQDARLYGTVLVGSVAGGLLAVGVGATKPPAISARLWFAIPAGIIAIVAVDATTGILPRLIEPMNASPAIEATIASDGRTLWSWGFATAPVVLGSLALAAAVHRNRGHRRDRVQPWGGWLVASLGLLVVSQLDALVWPAAGTAVVTTANLLRLGSGLVLAVGGVVALRRLAGERASLRAAHQAGVADLARLRQHQSDFAAFVAHELASPVTAIQRNAEMLADATVDGAVRAHAIDAIRSEVAHVQAMLGDVGSVAGFERAEFAVRIFAVPLGLLLGDAAGYARTLPGDHPLAWPQTRRERVCADPERIAQVLRNLLGNAAKYAPPGTPIEIRVARRDGTVRIAVVDHGPGVPAAEHVAIFEKFVRGRRHRASRVPGTGVGLYVARRIVRAHGWDLTVEDTPGGGATFAFELEVEE